MKIVKIICSVMGIVMLSFVLSSCATMWSKSNYGVAISSTPAGANFAVADRDGDIVHEGVTPEIVELDVDGGFFRKNYHTITYSMDGYDDKVTRITPRLDGTWLGSPIIDPLTGAMWSYGDGTSRLILGLYFIPIGLIPGETEGYNVKSWKGGVHHGLHRAE